MERLRSRPLGLLRADNHVGGADKVKEQTGAAVERAAEKLLPAVLDDDASQLLRRERERSKGNVRACYQIRQRQPVAAADSSPAHPGVIHLPCRRWRAPA